MPIHSKYRSQFVEGNYYHVYNRAVAGQQLFYGDDNYLFFLQKFHKYLAEYVDVYSWCLLPNHFHFFVRVKENQLSAQKEELNIDNLLVKQFKNFFISYSMALKKQQSIKTNIFAQKFKRTEIDKDAYFSEVIRYIHLNPFTHNIDLDWENYRWSSYGRIIKNIKSDLKVAEIVDWFGSIDQFIDFHKKYNPKIIYFEEVE